MAAAVVAAALLPAAPLGAQEARPDSLAPAAAEPEAEPCSWPGEGFAVVTGVVRDSATGVELPLADVSASWERRTGTGTAEESAKTSRSGHYALCAVPTGVPITVTGTFPQRASRAVLALPEDRELVRLDFRLGTTDAAPAEEKESTLSTLETGRSEGATVISGTVRDESTGAPLVGAQVFLSELERGTVTEPGGRFQIEGIPPGEHRLVIEHLGYKTVEKTLTMGEPVRLTAVAWLAPLAIEVDELVARIRQEEEAGRARGTSRYGFGREVFEKRPAASLVDVIRSRVPGARLRYSHPKGCPVILTRSGRPLYVVDGVPFRDGCILMELNTEDIASVEVYSATEASIEWGSLGGGGVIEITTRQR